MILKSRIPRASEMKALRALLKKYGDIPVDEAVKATRPSTRMQWLIVVDQNNKIYGGGRTYQKDWYEWVLKNAFVIPEARNKKIATMLYADLTDKAEAEGAKVCEADITSTNIPSKIAAVRAGMRPVNSFRWSNKKKDKPADIYQEVFLPPSRQEVNQINAQIRREYVRRGHPILAHTMTPYPRYAKPGKKLKYITY